MILLAPRMILWMAATVLLSWLAPRRLQMPAVILSTIAFLGMEDPLALGVMTAQAGLTLWSLPRVRSRGWLTATLVGLIVAILAAFKIQNHIVNPGRIIMPLGLSFTTFRLVHLIVDAYAGRLKRHDFMDLLAYLFFLPPLPVGPIHRFPDFVQDLRRRRFDRQHLGAGTERILHGYAKLVILRNLVIFPYLLPWFSRYADGSFRGDLLASIGQWIDLYISFSGCSDLAVGFSLIMGFRIQENFNHPYLASSLPDFWQRWHISLTSWCRDYIFAPVTAVTRMPALGVGAALLVIGLWHELSIRYLLWGIYHALGILLWHLFVPRLKAALPAGRWTDLTLRPLFTATTILFVLSSFAVTNRADMFLRSLMH